MSQVSLRCQRLFIMVFYYFGVTCDLDLSLKDSALLINMSVCYEAIHCWKLGVSSFHTTREFLKNVYFGCWPLTRSRSKIEGSVCVMNKLESFLVNPEILSRKGWVVAEIWGSKVLERFPSLGHVFHHQRLGNSQFWWKQCEKSKAHTVLWKIEHRVGSIL